MSGRESETGRLAIDGGPPLRARPFPRWPETDARDEAAVLAVVRGGRWWMYGYGEGELAGEAGGGTSRVAAAERAFALAQGVSHAVAVSSGSGALEIACRALQDALRGVPGIRPCRRNPETEADAYYLFILRYDADAWDGLPRAAMLAALNAEGIPAGSGYTFPIYENPLFRNQDFNGPRSPYRLGRDATVDFGRYRGACPVAEKACREEAIWLTQEILLGSEDDARDVARAFEKLHAGRGRIPGERR